METEPDESGLRPRSSRHWRKGWGPVLRIPGRIPEGISYRISRARATASLHFTLEVSVDRQGEPLQLVVELRLLMPVLGATWAATTTSPQVPVRVAATRKTRCWLWIGLRPPLVTRLRKGRRIARSTTAANETEDHEVGKGTRPFNEVPFVNQPSQQPAS